MMSERSASDQRVTLDYVQPVDPYEDAWDTVDDICVRAVVIIGIAFSLLALVSMFLS
jgi:hypothetical protein